MIRPHVAIVIAFLLGLATTVAVYESYPPAWKEAQTKGLSVHPMEIPAVGADVVSQAVIDHCGCRERLVDGKWELVCKKELPEEVRQMMQLDNGTWQVFYVDWTLPPKDKVQYERPTP